jgi:lipopolysaccharide/colanic/teichoic acid biosynthesis glycosyltransferase
MSTANAEIGDVATTSMGRAGTIRSRYESVKPWIDFGLAMVLLLFSAPIIFLAVILVRFSSRGSSTYTQKRLGLKGQVFTIYKIRTMYQGSERNGVPIWCVPGDRRITPLGRFLRFSHIDELPQLINVLKGEMSLVGPRPERPEFLAQLERAFPDYRVRLSVRPGLTGLAQVQQPPDTDLSSVRRKLNYDLCYVERMGLWLDLRLIVGTVLKCVGVPFLWIGRILQLPNPNVHLDFESSSSGTGLQSKSLRPDGFPG